MPRLPLGYSDYRKIREVGLSLVDKSAFIGRALANSAEVQLFCRPRRFGKTTNLSMLRYFLEKPGIASLFEGTLVLSDPAAMAHFGRYPVVYLTLKDVHGASWGECLEDIADIVGEEMLRHGFAVERPIEAREVARSLRRLTDLLAARDGVRAIVLIDEYDTPLHCACDGGFFEDAARFFRKFYGSTLKDNPSIERAVLTGILRVAKESIFSDLNNLAVDTVLDREFSSDFGFTEAEVAALVPDRPELMAGFREWYNGYRFGDTTVYNPWSIVSALSRPSSPLQPYWVSTGGTRIFERLATQAPPSVASDVERLLAGEGVTRPVVPGLALRGIERDPDAFFNLPLYSGYITAGAVSDGNMVLTIPNREVRAALRATLGQWLDARAGGGERVGRLVAGLLAGDVGTVESTLAALVLGILSYHDLADRTPERVYHAFVLGLFAHLPSGYRVFSNREFGDGRPDVVILSDASMPATLLEFKVADDGEEVSTAVDRAAAQITERRYVEGTGLPSMRAWAVGFSGKKVGVRLVG